MTSVIIAYRDDEFLLFTVSALLRGVDHSRFEIVIVDDGSEIPLTVNNTIYPNVRIIRNYCPRGVGYSFDRGVVVSKYENIVLMGSDVVVKDSTWLDKVEDYISNYRDLFGCSCCLSLDPSHLDPQNPANEIRRYGSTILPFYSTIDLRSDSPLLDLSRFDTGLFENKWIKTAPDDDIIEVPSLYGAFYFGTKSLFNHVRGWDTDPSVKMSGHQFWGGLECIFSLKLYLSGAGCYAVKSLETGHIFHKFTEQGIISNGRNDMFWYNKFFIAYMMLSKEDADRLIKKVYERRVELELYTMQFNVARKLIDRNWDYIMTVKQKNKEIFVHNFDWFCNKFNIERGY